MVNVSRMRYWNGNGCCVRKSLTNTAVLIFMLESSYPCYPVNRADGISEIEGKAAKGSGEQVGKGASFKSVVPNHFCVSIRIHSWLMVDRGKGNRLD